MTALGGGPDARRHRIAVVGAGGNIGSHLGPHLARMPSVAQVTLIDRDVYTRPNLLGQDLLPRDVGRRKARVQAGRLRLINPSLEVVPVPAAVEDLPIGRLRADVILACLDSRRARQWVNEAAWHLGVPWIDSGVGVLAGGALLARVCVYVPGPDRPCLECAWDDRDYESLEQDYPCGAPFSAPPTGAPSSLGALAASLLALECRMLLANEPDHAGRQVLLDAAHASLVVTRFRRRPGCRMTDHDVWSIARLPPQALDMTLQEALALGPGDIGDGLPPAAGTAETEARAARRASRVRPRAPAAEAGGPEPAPLAGDGPSLRVEGRGFQRRRVCTGCGRARHRLRVHAPSGAPVPCPACRGPMVATGFDIAECLRPDDLTASERALSLRRLGVRPGDVLRIESARRVRRFEIPHDRS